MSFTTVSFLFIFFPVSLLAYYLARRIHKILGEVVLVLFSIAFYGWSGITQIRFLLLYVLGVYLLGRIAFFCGRYEKSDSKVNTYKRQVIGATIAILLFVLFIYKYYNFLQEALLPVLNPDPPRLSLVVPLGLSYLFFSGISYIIDIYRGDALPGTLLETGNYITFFPKIACGPITLYKNFTSQKKDNIVLDDMVEGLNRIIIGMAKKLIFADYFGSVLATIPNAGIDQVTAFLTIIIYSLQLYFDFSGYSDMAIGVGRLFGYQLPDNFNYPYLSRSITEFWRRWHMSLGTFFKEYLYIPLGGNRKGKVRTLLNLLLVFLATGIWHGAGWNYIIWGMSHGICVVIERVGHSTKLAKIIPAVVKWICSMTVVFVGWQLFRFTTLNEVENLFSQITNKPEGTVLLSWQYYVTIKLVFLSLVGFAFSSIMGCSKIQEWLRQMKSKQSVFILRQVLLLILLIVVICCMASSTYSPFLYFRY